MTIMNIKNEKNEKKENKKMQNKEIVKQRIKTVILGMQDAFEWVCMSHQHSSRTQTHTKSTYRKRHSQIFTHT